MDRLAIAGDATFLQRLLGCGQRVRPWLLAFLLILPAMAPYAAHYLGRGERVATGFIQGDQPYYMAVAREYFDNGGVSLLYGNPLSGDFGSPRLYFQPSTFILGIAREVTRLDPGTVFDLFGLVAALLLARVMISLYRSLVGLAGTSRRIGLLLFFWGGGILALAGLVITGYYALYGGAFTWRAIFQLDPFSGWWMLNLGRNFVLPLESIYHLFFLGAVLLVMKGRYGAALGAALLLSASHPYTGSELLAILFVWAFVELLLGKRSGMPPAFFAGISVLLILHVLYYLVYLPRFPDHRVLMADWDQPWFFRPESMIAAYLLVGGTALWRLRSATRMAAFVAEGRNRLLLVWCVVAFLLANHQWFMHPVEPLHFTRGYIWASLFLIGAPSLVGLIERLLSRGTRLARVVLTGFVLLFLSDNGAWVTAHTALKLTGDVWLTPAQMEVLRWVDSRHVSGALLVSEDREVSRMSAVYSAVRPWAAVSGITPHQAEREREVALFFSTGSAVPAWYERPLVLVFSNGLHSSGDIPRLAAACIAGRSVIEQQVTRDFTVMVLR